MKFTIKRGDDLHEVHHDGHHFCDIAFLEGGPVVDLMSPTAAKNQGVLSIVRAVVAAITPIADTYGEDVTLDL